MYIQGYLKMSLHLSFLSTSVLGLLSCTGHSLPDCKLTILCLQQIWYFPGSSMSTRPSWSRTLAALSRRRRGTYTSPKWSPQTWETTPAWWPTRSPRPAFRVPPPHWCSAATVRYGNEHAINMHSHMTLRSFFGIPPVLLICYLDSCTS